MICQTVFAGCPLMMSSELCTLQFWQPYSSTEEKSWRKSLAWWKIEKKNTEKIIDFPIHLPYICHRNLSHFSVRPPGRASACFVKRFSQAVSRWCPLDIALYSLLRRTVLQNKKKEWQQILLKKQQQKSLTVFFHTNPITQEMRAKKSKNVMHMCSAISSSHYLCDFVSSWPASTNSPVEFTENSSTN